MYIGVIKEIKNNECRVAVTPEGVQALVKHGHQVMIESNAGIGSSFTDDDYKLAGAVISDTESCWDNAMVLKVKEPVEVEYQYLKQQIIFTFLHLAAAPTKLIETLFLNKTTAIAYETLEDKNGTLPLLAPMSALAGNMSVLVGSYYLAGFNGGKGVQLGTVLGESFGHVVIIGDGIVAQHAAKVALGMGAAVSIATRHIERKEKLQQLLSAELKVFISSPEEISRYVKTADLVIGAALNRGAKAPYLVSKSMIMDMQKGSVVVDVSIDQGGCIETSHPTFHSDPVFLKYGVIHYCVNNMPGAFPKTSTMALSNATLTYILKLADEGISAFVKDEGLALSINCYHGFITNRSLALSLGLIDQYKKLNDFF